MLPRLEHSGPCAGMSYHSFFIQCVRIVFPKRHPPFEVLIGSSLPRQTINKDNKI